MMEALSPANIGLLLFGIFFVLLLIGSPIMVALGVATMACFIVLDIDLSLMIERAFASLTAFPLMALPAFVLAGSLMEAAGVSRRLVHVAENIVGPTPGGLRLLRRHFRLRPRDHGRRGYAHDPGHGQARL